MAKREYVERLKQGVVQWNAWRKQLKDTNVDLSRADLREANLSEVKLRGAYLGKANLRGIPWLLIRELAHQPDIVWEDVLYD